MPVRRKLAVLVVLLLLWLALVGEQLRTAKTDCLAGAAAGAEVDERLRARMAGRAGVLAVAAAFEAGYLEGAAACAGLPAGPGIPPAHEKPVEEGSTPCLAGARLARTSPTQAEFDAATKEVANSGPSVLQRLADFRAGYTDGACSAKTRLGVTHTQYSLDSWQQDEIRTRGERLLAQAAMPQNQHIMGWGTTSPEPVRGVHDWSRLDERVALALRTSGQPVITLCCAPDWMSGGQPGATDWDRLGVAPSREHYADFARLCAEVARRYPQVKHFQVWNELKGFWDAESNTWAHAEFTDLYNAVYDAVKAVRPDALVGGPYVALDSWSGVVDPKAADALDHWIKHKHGADFVAVDASTVPKDGGTVADPFRANEMFGAATRWVAQRSGLPVWWSEFYVPDDHPGRDALVLDAVARASSAGAATMLLWQPQAGPDTRAPALWTENASPTTLARPWFWLARALPDGVMIARNLPGTVLTFTSPDGVLRVNLTDRPQGTLPPYGTEIR